METVPLRIEDIAFGGKGVGRIGGKACFVPFTITGEQVTARIFREKKNFAEAALLSVEHPSPDRVEPRCPYFGRCGGCSYQHITYGTQLAIKEQQVAQMLRRIGKLSDVPMRPAIASPQPYEYRNRIRVHAANGVVGFYAQDKRTLIDIECCPISSPAVNAALRTLRDMPLRDGDHTAAEESGGYFRQTNDSITPLLLAHVETLFRPDRALLVDAYCGAGLFAKHLAPQFERIVGIEENPHAVERARRSALAKESYLVGDVAAHLDEVLASESPLRTALLLDPPATGITPRVSDAILARSPSEIVYVSCDPATLARDLAILCRTYRLESVTPVDMFPQTAEIEVAAHLVLQQ